MYQKWDSKVGSKIKFYKVNQNINISNNITIIYLKNGI